VGYYLQKKSRRCVVTRRVPIRRYNGKRLVEVFSSGCWSGKRCFLIGGGCSLRGFNPARLDGELTIGINKAFEIFNSTINYGMDVSFYEYLITKPKDKNQANLQEKWKTYPGIRSFLLDRSGYSFGEDIYVVDRIDSFLISFNLELGIFGGTNSGFGALMLAISLAASPIYLLGYDMKILKDKNETHWHSGYPKVKVGTMSRKLRKFQDEFERFAPQIASRGIQVINLNQESALECFPKMDIENIL